MPREQEQFLDVVDRDEAKQRWLAVIRSGWLEAETVPLAEALGRVLAEDVVAGVDVPAFDRSNVDGYALQAAETFGASDETPRRVTINAEELATGTSPRAVVEPGTATLIATGAMIPRGADAVIMVEATRIAPDGSLLVTRPVTPGAHLSGAGSDMARGELVLRRGTFLTSRDTGVLAAIGEHLLPVIRRPRVAIFSTGDEIVAPGEPLRPASIYDSNATMLADAVREVGGEPVPLGIVGDDPQALAAALDRALVAADLVLLSGGTSKGEGDVSYRTLAGRVPGIVVHGVALKPGKPICLGAVGTTPIAILPGFPTSAIFTFHEFVAPVVRAMAGRRTDRQDSLAATMSERVNSEPGRTEYLLVRLIAGRSGRTAYPMGKGSGSVTAFSHADGFVVISKHQEYVAAGEPVAVVPLGLGLEPADLVVIGSHCVGLDWLLGKLGERGWTSKTIWVGSQGGLIAAGRAECDIAGVHLLDPATGVYNAPFLPLGVRLLPGYGRMQGLVFRPGDARFEGREPRDAIEAATSESGCAMVNRNRGSGTRILIDGLLGGRQPLGYSVEARSHNAVAVAVAQGRADWGVAIAPVAATYGLGFQPIGPERFDFAIPEARWDHPAVVAFRAQLDDPAIRKALLSMGFLASGNDG